MGLTVHFEVLNQLGTPMMHSATLANRPAAGIAGRIFFRTDSPFGIFRDTGSAWDQISGASTFSGSLAAGQVAFGSATDTIAGNNNLFWNNANARLGIGTNTPVSTLDVNGVSVLRGSSSYFGNYGTDGTGGADFYIRMPDFDIASFNPGISYYANGVRRITLYRGGNDQLFTRISGTDRMALFSTGNLVLQNGGTFVDAGQKLQVIGDTLFRGSGSTSSTNALLIQNSAGTQQYIFNNAGQAMFGINAPSSGVRLETDGIFRAWTQIELGQFGTASLTTTQFSKGSSGSDFYEFRNSSSHSAINGTYYFLQLRNTVNPTSGSAVVNGLNLNFTINQTGGANGINRGLYVNPTLTNAADWRSIEWSNNTGFGLYGAGTAANYLGGSLGIKTTAIYSPSTFSLDVNGGLLIKNTAGTTAQLTLINADPSLGGNNGFLVNSVGGTSGSSYVDLQGYYGTSITGSTALRLNPAGGPVIVNSTTNSGEQVQITGSLRVNGQLSPTIGTLSGQHLIINCDGTLYKINLFNP